MSSASRSWSWIWLCIALAAVPGCMPWRGPDDVARLAARQTGAEFDREFGLTIGRTGMALTRWIVRTAAEEEGIPLAGITKVEIGVYRREGGGDVLDASGFRGLNPLVEMMSSEGEEVLVLAGSRDDEMRRLVVVVVEQDELVVVRLRGAIERVIEDAVRFAMDQAEHPDLAEPAIARLPEEVRDRASPGGS